MRQAAARNVEEFQERLSYVEHNGGNFLDSSLIGFTVDFFSPAVFL